MLQNHNVDQRIVELSFIRTWQLELATSIVAQSFRNTRQFRRSLQTLLCCQAHSKHLI